MRLERRLPLLLAGSCIIVSSFQPCVQPLNGAVLRRAGRISTAANAARLGRTSSLRMPLLLSASKSVETSDTKKDTAKKSEDDEYDAPLPPALIPIWLGVFGQMLGEGIAISSLPLHMTTLGATPVQVGAATSCFSAAQMVRHSLTPT